jgi:hypothetical protein
MRAADLAARGQVVDYQRPAEKPTTPIRRYRLIRPPSLRCAGRDRQNREREFFGADYHPGDYVFTFDNGRPPHSHSIRQRFDRLAQPLGSRGSRFDLRHS